MQLAITESAILVPIGTATKIRAENTWESSLKLARQFVTRAPRGFPASVLFPAAFVQRRC